MLDVIIDRKKWLRGEGHDEGYLLRDDGKMCCIGFACLAAGHTKEEIKGLQQANEITGDCKLPHCKAGVLMDLYDTNDNQDILADIRERIIIYQGKFVEINFTFIN